MKEIYVFICEDEKIARALVDDHFKAGEITYAGIFPESKRDEIAQFLNSVEAATPTNLE